MTKAFTRSSSLLLLTLTLGFLWEGEVQAQKKSEVRLSVFGRYGRHPIAARLGATKKARDRGDTQHSFLKPTLRFRQSWLEKPTWGVRQGSLWSRPSRAG